MRELRLIPLLLVCLALSLFGCGSTRSELDPNGNSTLGSSATVRGTDATDPELCPPKLSAPNPLPSVEPAHRTAEYWIERSREHGDPDATLLSVAEIDRHVEALYSADETGRPIGQVDLGQPIGDELLALEVSERLAFLHQRLASGSYVERTGERMDDTQLRRFEPTPVPTRTDSLRIALEPIPLRCGPRVEGFYTESLNLEFDRNNCSTIRPQEPVQILAVWPSGMLLVRSSYALGFIAANAALSPEVPRQLVNSVLRGRRVRLSRPMSAGGVQLPEGTRIALSAGSLDQIVIGTPDQVALAPFDVAGHQLDTRALTRRAVLEEAFSLLGEPYGWGGRDGERDCSRFMLDVFGSFGVDLPRHSGRQANAGTFTIDIEGLTNEAERVALFEEASKKGLVLLHFPGHIMLYLGKTEEGVPMAIHSFAEYVKPCDDAPPGPDDVQPETLFEVGEITVSDLELGRGSSRTAFIQRINKVVVIGEQPGAEFSFAASRPAIPPSTIPEGCDDTVESAIFRAPVLPYATHPLRTILVNTDDPGPVALTLVDPSGRHHHPSVKRLGGPPFTHFADFPDPEPGDWFAVFGDGEHIVSCEGFSVRRSKPGRIREYHTPEGPAWRPFLRWEADTENFYSAFVEQLFMEPTDQDITWPKLQELLNNRDANLLHNYLAMEEDERLDLAPDCADLPYFLRAYFAWKLRLPFGFRRCHRGRRGGPPRCEPGLLSNLIEMPETNEVEMFMAFIRKVRDTVHSASARTQPDDPNTDVYPIPMTREWLRPGTVFADPYGHLLVLATWRAQGPGQYGVLMGADAQPDFTVGRRRFWRGSFLFTPERSHAGAGFKAWRPVYYNRRDQVVEARDDDYINASRFLAPVSMQQYEGTADDFYDRMEALINPRPLDPFARLETLVDALHESVQRRVNSVNNGETFMAESRYQIVEMPEGHAIFETSGAWENFSTPSRDMRLLISLDAVVGFPAAVGRNPERFGFAANGGEQAAAELRSRLTELLAAKSFTYTASDRSARTLTLLDLSQRQSLLEVAYNPNDCPEMRWAEEPGTAAFATCQRRAPAFQQTRMESYREWFRERRRPPRE